MAQARERSSWRWFPHWLALAMAAVFAVNAYMVYAAVTSFPGAAGTDGFDLSNDYRKILAAEQKQAALGWHVEAAADSEHRAHLRLTDKAGAPLAGAAVTAQAERPVGPPDRTALAFHAAPGGDLVADTTLFSGQWDVLITVQSDGRTLTATRRLLVR
ncbi:MAG: FixH family protein [Proteobacteria bacterium]|nr:FixH family protein [Pseudomonadota bacterium]